MIWRRPTLLLAVVGNLLALVGVLGAWYGASGEVTIEAQVRWVNLGVLSLVVAGVVTAVLLREARVRITDETRRLQLRLRAGERGAS